MTIINRLPELITKKVGGEGNINLSELQRETKLTYATVSDWTKGRVSRVDFETLDTWCRYLGVQPGDILTYED